MRHVADTEAITCQKWDTHNHRGNIGMKRTAAASFAASGVDRPQTGALDPRRYSRIYPLLTGTPDFPPPTGGWGVNNPSSVSAVGRRETKKRNVRKLIKNDYEITSVFFVSFIGQFHQK